MSLHTRRRTVAELAAEAAARASAHADDWGTCAPPRRPRLGHTADCPNNGRPMRRCGFCRGEQLEARPLAGVVRALIDSHPGAVPQPVQQPAAQAVVQEPEQHACSRCYAPTVNPDLCDRCTGGTP